MYVAQQRIDRVRRQYNKWVANQTLEDYALRFTAKSARSWSAARVANTAMGAISFLALEAIGGAITLKYGVTNASVAILVVSVIIFLCSLPITYFAARCGVDIDLLTRGAGFGYVGSTITSLIYASFTFIFFAIEAVILATALELCFGVPLRLGYVLGVAAVIPLVTYGVALISRFQLLTQPFWIVLQILPFLAIAREDGSALSDWSSFVGQSGGPAGQIDLVQVGAAASVIFALVAQVGEQVDFLRFLPRDARTSKRSWWLALLVAGPGWIVLGALKMSAGSFLAYFAFIQGATPDEAAQPAHMYFMAFRHVSANPAIAAALTGTFVVLSQLKINVTNAYAGSIAWSNFFSRLTHSHPGRVVWLVFNVLLALLLMEVGVYRALEETLALYGNVAVAWVGAIVADIVINRPLRLRPATMEFKRAHLYDVNPVGVGSMLLAATAAIIARYGVFGSIPQAFAPFIALTVALISAPLIALATGGRFYIARKPKQHWRGQSSISCCICELAFEPEDMASCPAYAGPICSLCCTLDARCHDLCKPHGRFSAQLVGSLGKHLPKAFLEAADSQIGRYLAVFVLSVGFVGLTLGLVYLQLSSGVHEPPPVHEVIGKVFLALVIIIGVAAWLFVLTEQSRRAAEAESQRQTRLLIQEIEAHQRTDEELQHAKLIAEEANRAKSRYVVGLSHELRSPLNAISGYAQLLDQDHRLPQKSRQQIGVIRRSADHLSGLIDGILDISKIEAGRIHISSNEVRLHEFLDQLVSMFQLQAAAKGIEFVCERSAYLPAVVHADENRLRQVLINLLANAVKFTRAGGVRFNIVYRIPICEFEIADTGPGIKPTDLERIFAPFERGELGQAQPNSGTGLGLTISRLLAGVMGGDISVSSEVGRGSVFRVKILLSEVYSPTPLAPIRAPIFGYHGAPKTVMVVDDDPDHRELLRETLAPLGFIMLSASDGAGCLVLAEHCEPDLFLLDVSMPGMDGWSLAQTLRETGCLQARILMVSASALEVHGAPLASLYHDAHLMKPINIPQLLELVGRLLKIEWRYESDEPQAPAWTPMDGLGPPQRYLDELTHLCLNGNLRGMESKLEELLNDHPKHAGFVAQMRAAIDRFNFEHCLVTLQRLRNHER